MSIICPGPDQLFPQPYALDKPFLWSVPVVVDSPHSGRDYPQAFLAASRLGPLALRKSEDCYVDQLFASAPTLGAPLLRMLVPRSYVDVNREPFELDPKLFTGPMPAFANVRSGRVVAGLGTVARIVAEGEDIYSEPLSLAQGLARIACLYQPYHAELTRLVDEAQTIFGTVVLLDCHSMPPWRPHEGAGADIVLGDRHGTSAGRDVVELAEEILRAQGFRVTRNTPYAGGFIALAHGKPGLGRHAVQIELNRALYLDPQTLEPTAGFAGLTLAIDLFLQRFFVGLEAVLGFDRRAAE